MAEAPASWWEGGNEAGGKAQGSLQAHELTGRAIEGQRQARAGANTPAHDLEHS